MIPSTNVTANVERFSGFAKRYDDFRPQPPLILLDILAQLAHEPRSRLVVDVGSGTGLSTRVWSDRADQVVGIEPNDDMRRQAESRLADEPDIYNVDYRSGLSKDTGLPDGCADIVTCSQSLHWMQPDPTFAEIARILRVGGVFAAYDCDWPPTMNWEAEVAYERFDGEAEKIGESRGWFRDIKQWAKEEHLARIRACGYFRFSKEIVVHNQEMGNAERLIGLALSQGGAATLLTHGMTETEIGVDELRAVCQRTIGDMPIPWYFSYRVRLGIK